MVLLQAMMALPFMILFMWIISTLICFIVIVGFNIINERFINTNPKYIPWYWIIILPIIIVLVITFLFLTRIDGRYT